MTSFSVIHAASTKKNTKANRISHFMRTNLSRLLLTMLPLPLMAQTASVPPAKVTGTAQVNGISAKCMIPKNGGTCSFNFPAYQAPVTGTTEAVSATVSLSGAKFTMAIQFPPESEVVTNPDGTKTITGATVTLTPVTK